MTGKVTNIPNLDRLIHEPARLAILAALSGVERVDFNYLLAALGLSRGNLSSHLSRLAEAEYITINKQFIGNMPNTSYTITQEGRTALESYWQELDALRADVQARPRASMPAAVAETGHSG